MVADFGDSMYVVGEDSDYYLTYLSYFVVYE